MTKKEERSLSEDELRLHLRTLIKDSYGNSQTNFCQTHRISYSYLSDFLSSRRSPGPLILSALGYQKVEVYREV